MKKKSKPVPFSILISALAQNMGHKDVGVIIASYGTGPDHERAGILKSFELESCGD